jgi:hypothetical protein
MTMEKEIKTDIYLSVVEQNQLDYACDQGNEVAQLFWNLTMPHKNKKNYYTVFRDDFVEFQEVVNGLLPQRGFLPRIPQPLRGKITNLLNSI